MVTRQSNLRANPVRLEFTQTDARLRKRCRIHDITARTPPPHFCTLHCTFVIERSRLLVQMPSVVDFCSDARAMNGSPQSPVAANFSVRTPAAIGFFIGRARSCARSVPLAGPPPLRALRQVGHERGASPSHWRRLSSCAHHVRASGLLQLLPLARAAYGSVTNCVRSSCHWR